MAARTVELGVDEFSSPETIKAAVAEMLATALFVFMGVGSVVSILTVSQGEFGAEVLPVAALSFGLTIALLAAGIGSISGGHINPAVTFAMVITGRVSVARGVLYVVGQLVGACLGMLLLRALIADEVILALPGAGGNIIDKAVVPGNLEAVGLEAVGTFLLVWTVFAVAVSTRGNSGIVAPLYIGLAVVVAHLVFIPLTGTGINPARTFGPALILGRWDDHWVYWVGPLIGAAAAALTYSYLYLRADEDPVPSARAATD